MQKVSNKQKWDHQKTVEMRNQGWQLIEADVWASPSNKRFRICFRDATMAEGRFPGKSASASRTGRQHRVSDSE